MNPSALSDTPKAASPDRPMVKAECRSLIANGLHNAFPVIARWRDSLWIAYREGDSHGGRGVVVLLRSSDAVTWKEVRRFDLARDNRDAILIGTEDRLLLYFITRQNDDTFRTYVVHTADGENFAAPEQACDDELIMWRAIRHKGEFYTAAYTANSLETRSLVLLHSSDGLRWTQRASIGKPPGLWSETTIRIGDDGLMTALVRMKFSHSRPDPAYGEVWQADAPYTQWRHVSTLPFRIEGPGLFDFQGVTYLLTRGFNALGQANAMNIHIWENGTLTPHCSIPCMRDCAYGHAIEHEGRMLMVFYCTAPDGVNLYLANVPLAG